MKISSRPVPVEGRESPRPAPTPPPAQRYVGIDMGAESIKVVELIKEGEALRWGRRQYVEHEKTPGPVLPEILRDWDWDTIQSAAVSGRLGRQVNLIRVPIKQAQAQGWRYHFHQRPGTVVSIGSHGFSVLELRANGTEVFRENSRCSQGTGNFLRQLVERFGLSIPEANALCAEVTQPAPLSGRCPVILKTDMTHLANKGENRAAILAGLFDAVCENVLGLIKPGISPDPVALIGGVSRSLRVQNTFRRRLASHQLSLISFGENEALYFESLGSAVVASRSPHSRPPLNRLLAAPPAAKTPRIPSLASALNQVQRREPPPLGRINGEPVDLILGFDIGSTGSKAVALMAAKPEVVWQGYLRTGGDPVGAAQELLQQYLRSSVSHCRILAFGVTGSGREIVGSLLTMCYGSESVFILNEIAAHAAGALQYDSQVDTIFEIGGQDAKYIRLAGGRVVDCAMNEACSAGTGSFIEEQGRKFTGIRDVVQLGQEALAAPHGVSLGQHCSVFMAEVIDEAVAAAEEPPAIMAGLFDSIIQNYLNRVKGSRSVGQVIFCQGMPFSSDALAAAVARQTGSRVVVPPHPGTVGALGIALLASREIPWKKRLPANLTLFLRARIEKKDHFVCGATSGCGGSGNKCRIDRIHTVVNGNSKPFNWGGGCALYDKGARKRKLPNLAPDPFREREGLVRQLQEACRAGQGRGRVALADQFMLKGLFPFFLTFFHELGFDLVIPDGAGQSALKRGIQEANVPFCAPMQLYHGLVSQMADDNPDFLFLPMVRSVPRMPRESHAVVCPIVQASADILRWDLKPDMAGRILSPVIDFGETNLESAEFLSSCRQLVRDLGGAGQPWRKAWQRARTSQQQFEAQCLEIGRRALDFCRDNRLTPVVVLGRPYTIYNTVLNSNVPAILREQGAIGIPLDCYRIDPTVPVFQDMYWGYAQRILRAAHQIRHTPGIYSLYCSNYSCGPDSFTLHFYSYIMEGKPFAIIETDGHSGDAGTKTRVEAFLHCVALDQQITSAKPPPNDFRRIQLGGETFTSLCQSRDLIIVPWMGPGSLTFAACLRSIGLPAEGLPQPDAVSLSIGRRYTSGKECLPMCLTLGNLVKRLQAEHDTNKHLTLLMPRSCGPCRFGIYNLLNRITMERLSWLDRLRIWAPSDTGYFDGTPPGWAMLAFSGFIASDILLQALLDVRPGEINPGEAEHIYRRYFAQLLRLLEEQGPSVNSISVALWQVASGKLFGIPSLLRQAAVEFARARGPRERPVVLLVGEIYVRCDPFANDFIIDKLEARGLRVRLAPVNEWLEYVDVATPLQGRPKGLGGYLSTRIQTAIRNQYYAIFSKYLNWPTPTSVGDALKAAEPFVRPALIGEAVLTVGVPRHDFHARHIDAVLSVGPLECMPNKIAEAQLFHVAEEDGLPALTLSLNGEAADPEVIDNFAFEVHARYLARQHV